MSSPRSPSSDVGDSKKQEQVSFRFCSECSNMLYPKEDERNLKLQYTCRTCQFTEDAKTTCVFRNNLENSAGETAGVTQDVGSDPTVSDISPLLCLCCGFVISCTECGQSDSQMMVWQVEQSRARGHAGKSSQPDEELADIIKSFAGSSYDDYDDYDDELFYQ